MRLFIHSGSGVVYDFQPGIPYSGNPKASVMQAYMIIRKTTPLISRKPFAFAKVFSEPGLTCGDCRTLCGILLYHGFFGESVKFYNDSVFYEVM